MRNKKRNRVLFLLILLLGIGIGFAALATTLKINGTAIINRSTWNIYWDNVANETGVTPETHPQITPDENNVPKTLLTWSVTLNEPGDFYEFEVDAVNAGTLDAEIIGIDSKVGESSIISTVDGELVEADPTPVPSYIKYSVKYADGTAVGLGDKLPKAPDLTSTPPVYTRKTYKIRVEYDRDAVTNAQVNGMEDDVTLSFTYHVTYGQAAPEVAPESPWTLPQGKTAETLAVSDEICIDDQCFNFIRYDENGDAVLLAKYNLKVGYINNSSGTKIGEYTSSDPGYGSQSSEARGYIDDYSTRNGAVDFSSTNYWSNGSGLKPEYGSSYPADVYDVVNYKTAPDFSTTCDGSTNCFNTPGYSVAYYVDMYETILTNLGATIKEARLLTYSEATDASIGCNRNSSSCPTNGFITNTTFWLGSASNDNYEWYVQSTGTFGSSRFRGYARNLGVRPVIVIEKSNL